MEREKVIRGLRDIGIFITRRLEHEKAKNFLRTIDETIIFLKEQDAVEPVLDKQYKQIWLCGNCGCFVGLANYSEFDKFCRECGHPVKWQDRHLQ